MHIQHNHSASAELSAQFTRIVHGDEQTRVLLVKIHEGIKFMLVKELIRSSLYYNDYIPLLLQPFQNHSWSMQRDRSKARSMRILVVSRECWSTMSRHLCWFVVIRRV